MNGVIRVQALTSQDLDFLPKVTGILNLHSSHASPDNSFPYGPGKSVAVYLKGVG